MFASRPARVLLVLAVVGCARPPASPVAAPTTAGAQDALSAVAFVHGGAGPWAVAGYRMGRVALARLGLPRQSFDLDVVHRTPPEVQYACVADGAAAATGASVGKLNLRLVDARASELQTTYRNRATGAQVTLRPTGGFIARYKDVPRERLADAGREVASLRDDEIFEEVPSPGLAGAVTTP